VQGRRVQRVSSSRSAAFITPFRDEESIFVFPYGPANEKCLTSPDVTPSGDEMRWGLYHRFDDERRFDSSRKDTDKT
jgi:hypothetical protein